MNRQIDVLGVVGCGNVEKYLMHFIFHCSTEKSKELIIGKILFEGKKKTSERKIEKKKKKTLCLMWKKRKREIDIKRTIGVPMRIVYNLYGCVQRNE